MYLIPVCIPLYILYPWRHFHYFFNIIMADCITTKAASITPVPIPGFNQHYYYFRNPSFLFTPQRERLLYQVHSLFFVSSGTPFQHVVLWLLSFRFSGPLTFSCCNTGSGIVYIPTLVSSACLHMSAYGHKSFPELLQ